MKSLVVYIPTVREPAHNKDLKRLEKTREDRTNTMNRDRQERKRMKL